MSEDEKNFKRINNTKGTMKMKRKLKGGFVIARAASVSGLPRLVGCKGWALQASGGELRLTKSGLLIIVR